MNLQEENRLVGPRTARHRRGRKGQMEPMTRLLVRGEGEGGREMPFPNAVRRLWVPAVKTFLPLLLLLSPIPMARAAAPQAGVSWDYRLLGPLNQAQDPETLLTIVLTGSGSFDTSASTITGGGGYTILDPIGSVVGSGTWTTTTFDSFTPTPLGGSPAKVVISSWRRRSSGRAFLLLAHTWSSSAPCGAPRWEPQASHGIWTSWRSVPTPPI